MKDGYDVMWTSGKETHQPLNGPAYSLVFSEQGIDRVFESALSMWPVEGKDKRLDVARFMEGKIDKAFKKYKNESNQVL